jgi:hypothetical protein
VKSGYDNSEMRRPVLPEEKLPLESGLASSGGASFSMSRSSFRELGQFGAEPFALTRSSVEWISNIYRSAGFLIQEVAFGASAAGLIIGFL